MLESARVHVNNGRAGRRQSHGAGMVVGKDGDRKEVSRVSPVTGTIIQMLVDVLRQ